jgi:hypothetical protein
VHGISQKSRSLEMGIPVVHRCFPVESAPPPYPPPLAGEGRVGRGRAADRLRTQLSSASMPYAAKSQQTNRRNPGLVSCPPSGACYFVGRQRGATTRRAAGAACPARVPHKRRKEGRGTGYKSFPQII